MNVDKLANNLKKLRLENNLSQEELSRKLFVSRQAVSRWETGKSIPDYSTLLNICDYYKITLDSLFGLTSKDDLFDLAIKSINSGKFYKKALKVTAVFVCGFLLLFSMIFTIKFYNRNSIYEMEYKSNDISCNQGLLVTSPDYIYFSPCKIHFEIPEELKKVKYYYIYDGEEKLIVEGGENAMNFIWRDTRKNSELFNLKQFKIDESIPDMYVSVITENNREYTLHLSSNKLSSNKI